MQKTVAAIIIIALIFVSSAIALGQPAVGIKPGYRVEYFVKLSKLLQQSRI